MENPIIYTSEYLRTDKCTAPVAASLFDVLDRLGVEHRELKNSNDYWIRDFMPVCLFAREGMYARYKYQPDYLWDDKKNRQFITCQSEACSGLNLFAPFDMRIIFDGGNYVRCDSKVIMTDKIFMENPRWLANQLVWHMRDILCGDIILLPWDMKDPCGHADGMIAYIGDNRILLNNYGQNGNDKAFHLRLRKILDAHFDIVELSYNCKPNADSWCYLNYLSVPNAIILPALSRNADCENDQEALKLFSNIFPDKEIIPVYAKPLIKRGGALHCVTWEYYEHIAGKEVP